METKEEHRQIYKKKQPTEEQQFSKANKEELKESEKKVDPKAG